MTNAEPRRVFLSKKGRISLAPSIANRPTSKLPQVQGLQQGVSEGDKDRSRSLDHTLEEPTPWVVKGRKFSLPGTVHQPLRALPPKAGPSQLPAVPGTSIKRWDSQPAITVEPAVPPPAGRGPERAARRKESEIDRITVTSPNLQGLVERLEDQMGGPPPRTTPVSERVPVHTPEPDWMAEYGPQPEGAAQDGLGYTPKRCWCLRCQIMYRMHREKDPALRYWGNYPCYQW